MVGVPVSVWCAVAIVAGAAAGVVWRLEAIADALPGGVPWIAAVALAVLIAVAVRAGRGVIAAACVVGLVGGAALGVRAAREALAPALAALAGDDPVALEGVLRDDAGRPSSAWPSRSMSGRHWSGAAGYRSRAPFASRLAAWSAATRDEWRAGRLSRDRATLRRPLPYRNFGVPNQEVRVALRGTRLFGTMKSAALIEVIERGSGERLPRSARA